jgi:hypothetical protein
MSDPDIFADQLINSFWLQLITAMLLATSFIVRGTCFMKGGWYLFVYRAFLISTFEAEKVSPQLG